MNLESIFSAALNISDPVDRMRYLDEVCANNPSLRKEVDELLAAESETGLLDRPPVEPVPTGEFTDSHTEGELIAGRYRLLQAIGEGGMGIVWMAEQLHPVKRRVALKVIKLGMDSRSVIARFEAERQALAMMDHPNISKVLDAGATADGRPFFVMELVKGIPITKYCDQRRLTPKERLELFIPVCHAIQHAHQKGIIHRDIKPSNVLVAQYDDHPVPKVIDFGVAKAIGGGLTEHTLHTKFGTVVGTPEYMSPEQAQLNELDVDTRSDVYSLGVLLYELLAGSPPIEPTELARGALLEMLRMIREVDPPSPSSKLSTTDKLASIAAMRKTEPARLTGMIKGDLDWIVMKCLDKSRNRRYETANALALDIQRHLADEPVLAGPPSLSYKFRKFAFKHRTSIALTGMAFVALLAIIVGLIYGLRQATLARDAEAQARFDAEKAQEKALAAKEEAQQARRDTQNSLEETRKEKNAKEAALERSEGLRLAAEANAIRAEDPSLSLLLGLEATKRFKHPLTFAPLFEAAAVQRELQMLNVVVRGGAQIVKWSHDGRRFVTAGGSESLQAVACIWDASDRKPLILRKGNGLTLESLDWNRDGTLIATSYWGEREVTYTDGKSPARVLLTDSVVDVWDTATGRTQFQLRGHTDRVVTVRFSPDGSKLLTASFDKTAKIWDGKTGKLLHTLSAHQRSLADAFFSPDGKKVLTLADRVSWRSHYASKTLEELNVDAKDPEPSSRPIQVTYSGSGTSSHGIGGQEREFARLWDAETGKQLFALDNSFENKTGAAFAATKYLEAARACFSGDGKWIGVGFREGTCHAYSAEVANKRKDIPAAHASEITAIVSRPGRADFATGCSDGSIQLWHPEVGIIPNNRMQMKSKVKSILFEPNGPHIISLTTDSAAIWRDGKLVGELAGHRSEVSSIAIAPDGRQVVTGSKFSARVWNMDPPPPVGTPLSMSLSSESVSAAAANREGTLIAIAGNSGYVQLHDAKTLALRWRTRHLPYRVQVLTFSNDGKNLWAGYSLKHQMPGVTPSFKQGDSFSVRIGVNDGVVNYKLNTELRGTAHLVESPRGDRLLWGGDGEIRSETSFLGVTFKRSGSTASSNRILRLFDLKTNNPVRVIEEMDSFEYPPGEFSSNGEFLVSRGKRRQPAMFRASDGKVVAERSNNGPSYVSNGGCRFAPDGRSAICWDYHNKGTIWALRAADGSLIDQWNLADHCVGFVQTKDQMHAIFLTGRSPIMVAWSDLDLNRPTSNSGNHNNQTSLKPLPIVKTFVGHTANLVKAAISPDGERLATAAQDGTVIVWKIGTTEIESVYVNKGDPATFLAFIENDRVVARFGSESKIMTWPRTLLTAFESRRSRELSDTERDRYGLGASKQ